jgi:hypothetical protein
MQLSVFQSDGEKAKLNVRQGPVQWTTSSHQQGNRISPPPSGMFVTTHFKRSKDKDIGMFNQALCNIKTHSCESSIIQT